MFILYALSLALLIPPTPDQELVSLSPRESLHQPFVELLQVQGFEGEYRAALKALRSSLIDERDQKIQELKQLERGWNEKLDSAREQLQALNKQGSADTEVAAKRRSHLHIEIASLERVLREKAIEREHTIPSTYELQLTKLWLAEHWPERREEIRQEVAGGQARSRTHGDAEDIGYRSFVEDADQDIEQGRKAARQMAASGWLPREVEDHEVRAYVQGIAARIAANSDLKVPLHVTVLDSEELTTLALPGGFLYVTTGVIRAAHTESELAGVLSREIARIAARHAARSAKASWMSKLVVPLTQIATGIFTAGAFSPAAYYGIGYGVEGLSGALVRVMNGTSEKLEKEADQLGIQYAWKAGYDPRGFVAFLDSISAAKKQNFLSGEPSLQERLLNSFTEIQYLPAQRNAVEESGEFDRIRRRLAR